MNYKYCINCGTKLPANTKFCTKCGTNQADQKITRHYCPRCGSKVSANESFCSNCGFDLNKAFNITNTITPNSKPGRNINHQSSAYVSETKPKVKIHHSDIANFVNMIKYSYFNFSGTISYKLFWSIMKINYTIEAILAVCFIIPLCYSSKYFWENSANFWGEFGTACMIILAMYAVLIAIPKLAITRRRYRALNVRKSIYVLIQILMYCLFIPGLPEVIWLINLIIIAHKNMPDNSITYGA